MNKSHRAIGLLRYIKRSDASFSKISELMKISRTSIPTAIMMSATDRIDQDLSTSNITHLPFTSARYGNFVLYNEGQRRYTTTLNGQPFADTRHDLTQRANARDENGNPVLFRYALKARSQMIN